MWDVTDSLCKVLYLFSDSLHFLSCNSISEKCDDITGLTTKTLFVLLLL